MHRRGGALPASKALQPGADWAGLELPLVALDSPFIAVAHSQQRWRSAHAKALGQLGIGRLRLPERLGRDIINRKS